VSDDTVSIELIGRIARAIEADIQSLRENDLVHAKLGHMVRHKELLDELRVLSERIGQVEATTTTHFDRLERRLNQTEKSIEERLSRIENHLAALLAQSAP
jgi:hypothetical protein